MNNNLIMNQNYWNERWTNHDTGWDVGYPSPALTQFIDTILNKDAAILIPGCGNAYEATYLVNQGFTNITVLDIAPQAVENLKSKFADNTAINIVCEDFFEHNNQYDTILEQTFLCALDPTIRKDYVIKMHQLLKDDGKLVGVLFNTHFNNPFPPFGGSISEYQSLFSTHFDIQTLEDCYNSIPPRQGREAFIQLIKK